MSSQRHQTQAEGCWPRGLRQVFQKEAGERIKVMSSGFENQVEDTVEEAIKSELTCGDMRPRGPQLRVAFD